MTEYRIVLIAKIPVPWTVEARDHVEAKKLARLKMNDIRPELLQKAEMEICDCDVFIERSSHAST